jgi:hypothetical protein
MRKTIWAFIVVVAAADVYFTWSCRDSVAEWEANPVAAWVNSWAGLPGMFAYRVLWLGFAAAMAWMRTPLSRLVTPVWGAGHLYLLVLLVQAYPHLPQLRAYAIANDPARGVGAWDGPATLADARPAPPPRAVTGVRLTAATGIVTRTTAFRPNNLSPWVAWDGATRVARAGSNHRTISD